MGWSPLAINESQGIVGQDNTAWLPFPMDEPETRPGAGEASQPPLKTSNEAGALLGWAPGGACWQDNGATCVQVFGADPHQSRCYGSERQCLQSRHDLCWEDKGNFCAQVTRAYPSQSPCYDSEWQCQQSRQDFCWQYNGAICVKVFGADWRQSDCYATESRCWQSRWR